jgi:hypothetical protein
MIEIDFHNKLYKNNYIKNPKNDKSYKKTFINNDLGEDIFIDFFEKLCNTIKTTIDLMLTNDRSLIIDKLQNGELFTSNKLSLNILSFFKYNNIYSILTLPENLNIFCDIIKKIFFDNKIIKHNRKLLISTNISFNNDDNIYNLVLEHTIKNCYYDITNDQHNMLEFVNNPNLKEYYQFALLNNWYVNNNISFFDNSSFKYFIDNNDDDIIIKTFQMPKIKNKFVCKLVHIKCM